MIFQWFCMHIRALIHDATNVGKLELIKSFIILPLLQFVVDRRPVFYRTYPGPAFPISSIDDNDVKISLNGNVGQVHFKKMCIDLTMTYFTRDYIDYKICVPKNICTRSTGHLGSCTENQGTIRPDDCKQRHSLGANRDMHFFPTFCRLGDSRCSVLLHGKHGKKEASNN